MKKFLHDNSLSIALFALFFLFLVGLSISGHRAENEELLSHSQPLIGYLEYIRSGGFIEAVFENWESEFLQMGALVLFTIWFHQKGAPDSKKLKGSEAVDTGPRYSVLRASSWNSRKKAIAEGLYANSLTIALFALFLVSFILHALGGTAAANQKAMQHGEETLNTLEYVRTSQFWFESFQNWQSEFLAVGALIVLSVFLRQRKSTESKPVGEPNSKTGS